MASSFTTETMQTIDQLFALLAIRQSAYDVALATHMATPTDETRAQMLAAHSAMQEVEHQIVFIEVQK